MRRSRKRTPFAIHAVDSLGAAMSFTGPYEELNVPFAPRCQPGSGRNCSGCAHGATAIAATSSTTARLR